MRITTRFFLIIFISSLSVQVLSDVPRRLDQSDFRGGIYQSNDLYIAGQPLTTESLQWLKREGITTVVNLRTDREMANPDSTPIDEATLLTELGIKYVSIPSGGNSTPHSPAVLDGFAKSMENNPGKTLLHCYSGRRATHLWVAYLLKYKNLPIAEAMQLGRAANFGKQPIEAYLEG